MVCQSQSHWIRASVYSSRCCEVCKYEEVYPRVQNASKWQYCVGFSFSTAQPPFPQALQQQSQQKEAVVERTGPRQECFQRAMAVQLVAVVSPTCLIMLLVINEKLFVKCL